MTKREVEVVKVNGERQIFDSSKLHRSLKRAGAHPDMVTTIVDHIENEIEDGMSTQAIYKHAFSLLRKSENLPVAARYSIRRAVFGLGPSGFPFEKYVSELFRAKGYAVEVGAMVKGECATHEVDMLAHNSEEYIGAELKFHNNPGIKTDLKVALYVRERFEDIKRGAIKSHESPPINESMLITNTKFTNHAVSYAECAGLKLLGWNYPKHDHLEMLIEDTGVYPITTLTTLSTKEKMDLLREDIVICNGLVGNTAVLEKIGIKKDRIALVLEESQALCQRPK